MPDWGFAVDVEGSVGVESGCEIPGVEDERTNGDVFRFVLESGGCDSGTSWVAGTAATVRESDDGTEPRGDGEAQQEASPARSA